jgi:hypothetical protein
MFHLCCWDLSGSNCCYRSQSLLIKFISKWKKESINVNKQPWKKEKMKCLKRRFVEYIINLEADKFSQ